MNAVRFLVFIMKPGRRIEINTNKKITCEINLSIRKNHFSEIKGY